MTRSEAVSIAVERVKTTNDTVAVIRRGKQYDVNLIAFAPRGWRCAEMIGPGNVQNYTAQS